MLDHVSSLIRALTIWFALLLCGFATSLWAQDLSVVGQFSPVFSTPWAPVHLHLLPTGKVIFWPGYNFGDNAQIWDPATQSFTSTPFAGYNLFCAGHAFLSDGRLLVTGGNLSINYGLTSSTAFDSSLGTWASQPDMSFPRWYPTNTALSTGDMLVTSGEIDPTTGNASTPEIYQLSTSTWRSLSTAQLQLPLYPMMFQAPNGKVVNVGPGTTTRYLDTTGTGAWTAVGMRVGGARDYGSAVMYAPGKILVVGGGNPPVATAEIIDLGAPTPAWKFTGSMAYARRQLNATLLPDGRVLVTGGSSGAGFNNASTPVLPAEVWDPATGLWTQWASLSGYRGYHSTAVLLPDGRVFSGGGSTTAQEGGGISSAEIFSPPYLFQGARPTITSAPMGIIYGQKFTVTTPDAASIAQVTLVRLGSATHGFNQNQLINFPAFTQVTGGISVTAPSGGNLAPPGHYMLFLVNGNKVPSVASIVRLDSSLEPPPAAPSNLSASPVSDDQINLAWTNGGSQNGTKIERALDGINFTQIAVVSGNASTYSDTGLTAQTQYTYRARAYNIDNNSAYSNSISATTLSNAPASLSPASLTFAQQVVGTSSSLQPLTLSAGSSPLGITSIAVSANFTQTNNCGTRLAAGTSCTISVVFAPGVAGNLTGTVTITDDASNSPQSSSLVGTAVAAVSLYPADLAFGAVYVGATMKNTTKLTNNQAGPLTISNVATTAGYTQSNNCGTTVAAGAGCTFTVTFAPTTVGANPGTLTITDGANNSPQIVTLGGTGLAPVILSPGSLHFPNTVVTTGSQAQNLTLTNRGATTVNLSSILASASFTQSNNCGSNLASGASCLISVSFVPTALGTLSGNVTVTHDAYGSPQSVALTGTALAPLTLSGSQITFGNQTVGTTSAPKIVTLNNRGGVAIAISNIISAGDYAQTNNCGSSLPVGSTCTVNITFTPTAKGMRTGSVTINDNSINGPHVITTSGNGT